MDNEIKFEVEGSQGDEYELIFQFNDGQISGLCSCKAGENGLLCRHILMILDGDSDDIISDNESDVSAVGLWFRKSNAYGFYEQMLEAEKRLDEAKREAALKKKRFGKVLMGLRL